MIAIWPIVLSRIKLSEKSSRNIKCWDPSVGVVANPGKIEMNLRNTRPAVGRKARSVQAVREKELYPPSVSVTPRAQRPNLRHSQEPKEL